MVLEGYRNPPRSPAECAFARPYYLPLGRPQNPRHPCQFGGSPVCAECGCVASAGMHTLAGFKLGGIIPLSTMLNSSIRLGGVPAPRHRAVNRFGGRRRRFFL